MGCFCHAAVAPLPAVLARMNVPVQTGPRAKQTQEQTDTRDGEDEDEEQTDAQAEAVPLAVAGWLAQRGLPAAPWTPEPGWLALPLPRMTMSTQTVATISALASLRAQVAAQHGIDLLHPQQAAGFARIVATMNARISAMAARTPGFNPTPWVKLAALNAAVERVTTAMDDGVLQPTPAALVALTVPGGAPMARWGGFLARLQAVAPMIAATTQLDVGLTETAQLSAALRVLTRLALPPLAAPEFMARLTAALSAVAQLALSLGADPLQLGFPEAQRRVKMRLAVLLAALSARLNVRLVRHRPTAADRSRAGGGLRAGNGSSGDRGSPADADTSPDELLALLPPLPVVPSSFATAAVVQAALRAKEVAALNWQVPAQLPAAQIGLRTLALTSQLQAALNIRAVLPAPCASGCDATKLMRGLAGAA